MIKYDTQITIDTDWADDKCIEYTANMLIDSNIRATWFITHMSTYINNMISNYGDLFEFGMHPLLPCVLSTGDVESTVRVMDEMRDMLPFSTVIRTHKLVQSTDYLGMICDYGLKIDASVFLPEQRHIYPHKLYFGDKSIVRIPYYWQDDFEIRKLTPNFEYNHPCFAGVGLKILNFHPVHVYYNSMSFSYYDRHKATKKWRRNNNGKTGITHMFKQVISHLDGGIYKSLTMSEILDKFGTTENML